MSTMTFTGSTTTVGADEDTWGEKNNDDKDAIAADLQTLNTALPNSFKGNNTGTAGPVVDMSKATATALLNPVIGDTGSGGAQGLVPSPAAGDAAKGKVLRASGAFGYPMFAHGGFVGATGAAVGTANNLSCTRNGTGDYTFAFGAAAASANYMVLVTQQSNSSIHLIVQVGGSRPKTTAGFSVSAIIDGGGATDPNQIYVAVLMLA